MDAPCKGCPMDFEECCMKPQTDYGEIVRLRTKLARYMEEVEAWRAVLPQYEYRDGAILRTLASLPPSADH